MSESKKLAIIVHSGTIDQLLCAFILGSTAVSLDWEAHMYFTFWGLTKLKKGEMDKTGLPATYKHMEEDLHEKLKAMNYPTPYEMLKRMKASGRLTLYACTPRARSAARAQNTFPKRTSPFSFIKTFQTAYADTTNIFGI